MAQCRAGFLPNAVIENAYDDAQGSIEDVGVRVAPICGSLSFAEANSSHPRGRQQEVSSDMRYSPITSIKTRTSFEVYGSVDIGATNDHPRS